MSTFENQKEKNWKAESKTVSLVYDMYIYVENPEEYFLKLLYLISEFNKVAGDNQYTKSMIFLYNYILVMSN